MATSDRMLNVVLRCDEGKYRWIPEKCHVEFTVKGKHAVSYKIPLHPSANTAFDALMAATWHLHCHLKKVKDLRELRRKAENVPNR